MINKVSKSALFLLLSILFAAVPGHAQEKYTYSYSLPPQSSRYVQDHSIEVDDVPGHKIRIVEIQRLYAKDHPVVMGTKVVESWLRGFTDYIGAGGPSHGYETWILEDGNKIFLEWTAISRTEATSTGSRRGTSHATSRFVGGTGKFASMQGTLTATVEFDTDSKAGYSRPTSQGEYWFAK